MAAACGGSEGDVFEGPGGPGTSGPTIAELRGELTAIFCDAYETCVGPMAKLQFGEQTCEQTFGPSIEDGELSLLEEAVNDGKVQYHQDKAQACLDAMATQGCDLFTTRTVDECLETITGTVAEDGDCTLDFECQGELFCKADASCPGTCTALQVEGTSCTDSDECVDGLVCDDNLERCATPAQLGAACDGDAPSCTMGLSCWGDEEGPDGRKCIANDDLFTASPGAACDMQAGELCAVDSYCALDIDMTDPRSPKLVGTCESMAASGAACQAALPDMCPGDEYCKTPPSQPQQMPDFNGTCTPLPLAGAGCRQGNAWAPECETGAACVDGTCETIARLGESCAGDDACASEACVDSVCVVPTACTN